MNSKLVSILFILYILSIFILGSIVLNTEYKLTEWAFLGVRLDLVLHFITFLPWSFFIYSMNRNIYLWFVIGLIFAGLTELSQHFVIHRSVDMLDFKANIIGITTGFLLVLTIKAVKISRKNKNLKIG